MKPLAYRHNVTRKIYLKPAGSIYYRDKDDKVIVIPEEVVEKSSDFTAIGKELFVTEDGVQIYEGDSWWYVTVAPSPHVARTNTMIYGGRAENMKPIRRFSNEFAARDFAKSILNSPTLSLIELELFATELKISKATLKLIKNKYKKS
jgi:hypothetical protein